MKRSKFNLSNYKLLSCDMGELIPCGLLEVLPGDTVQQATSALVRCSPLLAPVMHPVHVGIRHYFVPFRLLWDKWEDFITGGPAGTDASVFPTITFGTAPAVGSLADYLGVPAVTGIQVSALPFRAYNLIWNECFRDQDLQTELVVSIGSGADTTTSTALQYACWEKDYFTSARPWEQKGPAVTIPLGSTAPVKGIGYAATGTSTVTSNQSVRETGGATVTYTESINNTAASPQFFTRTVGGGVRTPDIVADLANASAVTVNVLREALALQRYEEARARYGSRYTEYLRYLGVQSSDARQQRPEYLGGGKQTIQFSEVLQTAQGTDPVGKLRGHGIGAMRSNRYRRYFEEHGFVVSLLFVRPKTIYTQGLEKLWNRRFKDEFWQREFETIGQQEVLNKEVYAPHTTPNGIFGYQDRYDEYRQKSSSVAGEFRTSTLDYWHMSRTFGSNPALNATFVQCTPTERVFAIPSEDNLHIMTNHSIQARRLVASAGVSRTM